MDKRKIKIKFTAELQRELCKVRLYFNILLIIFIFSLPPLFAQEAETETAEDQSEETVIPPNPASQRLEMEIKTSTLAELAVWCRTLGLTENGTRDELSNRIREHLNVPKPAVSESSQKIIVIESAQTSEYFSIDVIGEDYARLKGDVNISLIDGAATHRIRADEILFNRTRSIITARGGIVYEKNDNDGTEIFRGENITVNIDTWESVFLDGSTEKRLDNDGTSYLFTGTVISRTENDTTILRKATIRSANNEEALWSISASKIWLLPTSDFAIANAVLKVGEIPVLYIPFFFFPGDDLVFHPVLGVRTREGAFIQTTTYILGQPKADPNETSSLSKIMGSNDDKEKKLSGLFLRSTGKKYIDQNEISLKLLLDYYINLGAYLGIDLNIPKIKILNPLEFSFGFGFSRTLTERTFIPFKPNDDGVFDGKYNWDHSYFFSKEVPFRYRMRFGSSISGRYGSLAWSFPFFSDPYMETDFLNRSESMDFMNMIQSGMDALTNDATIQSEAATYQWHVNGNINPNLPVLAPYISRISISNISTTLTFRTLRDDAIYSNNSEDPRRVFYAPDKLTIYNISGAISGTPLTIGGAGIIKPKKAEDETPHPLDGIGTPISPWSNEDKSSEESKSNQNANSQNAPVIENIVPPVINQAFNLPRMGNARFIIDYSITPTSSAELQFLNTKWKAYEDVKWDEKQSILTSVGGNASLNFRVDHTNGLFSNTVSFTGSGTWRDYNYLNEEAFIENGTLNEDKLNAAKRQQYGQTNYSTFYAYNGTVRPFYRNEIFSQTNFQYNFRGTLVRSKRYDAAASPDGPEVTPVLGLWAKEERKDGVDIFGLTNHRISANLSAVFLDQQQTLSFSADLPPLDETLITNMTIRLWISESNLNFRFEKPSTPPAGKEEGDWVKKPVFFTQTLKFNNKSKKMNGVFSFHLVADPELVDDKTQVTNITTSLVLWNFKTSFQALRIKKSVFVDNITGTGGSWITEGEPTLLPKELAFSFNYSVSSKEYTKRKLVLSFNINTSLNFDLQQHTNSNFNLTLGFGLIMTRFLEITFSATVNNSVIWRYFKWIPGLSDLTRMYPDGPQNNIFIDLWDSFNFLDDSKRRRTGFKIQRLNLSIIHFLGDWNAELGVSMYPYLQENKYKLVADVKFLIQWKPIIEIKTDIGYDGKTEKWSRR